MERSCGPRISLFILGTRHSPFVPIVPIGTSCLQGTLSDPLVSTERSSSEFSALSVRALPFLRALRALRGSVFSPCSLCLVVNCLLLPTAAGPRLVPYAVRLTPPNRALTYTSLQHPQPKQPPIQNPPPNTTIHISSL